MTSSSISGTSVNTMDFLARLDQRLLETPKPTSQLAPYIEAHMLFQRNYHTPSPTPTPPSSPELDTSTIAASKQAQSSTSTPRSRPLERKRKRTCEDNEGDKTDALRKQMRTSHTHKCSIQPCTPTATAMPSPATCSASPRSSELGTLSKEHQEDAPRGSVAPRVRDHALQQWPGVRIGKYTLRRNAARAWRWDGQSSTTR
jgi:hypothetical protein